MKKLSFPYIDANSDKERERFVMKMKNVNVRDTNRFKQGCKTDLSVYKQMKILCEHRLQRKREQNMKMTLLCELEGTRSTATTVKAAFADQQY